MQRKNGERTEERKERKEREERMEGKRRNNGRKGRTDEQKETKKESRERTKDQGERKLLDCRWITSEVGCSRTFVDLQLLLYLSLLFFGLEGSVLES